MSIDQTNQQILHQIQLFWKVKKREKRKFVFEARSDVYLLGVGLDHDVAVDEDGADDGAREQRMCEHVDGDPGA